jgi:hypothetical protein
MSRLTVQRTLLFELLKDSPSDKINILLDNIGRDLVILEGLLETAGVIPYGYKDSE